MQPVNVVRQSRVGVCIEQGIHRKEALRLEKISNPPCPAGFHGPLRQHRQNRFGVYRGHDTASPEYPSGGEPHAGHLSPVGQDRLRRIVADEAAAQFLDQLARAARGVHVPSLLVRGRLSDIVSDDGVDDLRRLIPHVEYVDVAGAGHMVAGDDNDAFNAAVESFLARLR